MQFSRYRMKCVSRLRFLLPLRSLLSFAFAPAFRSRSALLSLCFPFAPLLSASFLSAFRFPFLSSALASASHVRSASLLPSRFAFALLSGFRRSAFQLLSFRFRFRLSARSALPFGFRLRSSLRILPFRASCVLSFFASFPFGFFASLSAFASCSLCSASLRFRSVPLPCCFLHSYSVPGFTRSLKTIHLQED